MCPDEILDYYDDYSTREYNTTLMLGDVSGFTELAEKYTTSSRGGPSKLTDTLNSYISPMVQEILSHKGDVLKFSGDAFLVMWKLQDGLVMRDLATVAMQTACIIQKHFGIYETDIGVTLRVKIAIASGKTYFTSVGDPEWMSHYIITGRPMWDAKFAVALCRGGDIIVAPSTWQWANPKNYVFKILPDGRHTLILAGSTMWEIAKNNYNGDIKSTVDHSVDSENSNLPSSETPSVGVDMSIVNLENQIRQNRFQSIDYTLRPKVTMVAKKKLKNQLRSYMLKPVTHSVESDEPLEHLAEIRQVVIVFINIITDNIGRKKLIFLVNKAFKFICRIVTELQGCVNKVSLFDKDLMFLCIFGLKGGKQELEAQIALRCASRLKSTLSSINNINSVTIGVSTGMTYCGVVGHILRREYTVIGMPVNKAARLMVNYENKVVCDRESFLHSRLEAGHFILQESKYLKGISNVGPIYEFDEEVKELDMQPKEIMALLNRKAEMKFFIELLSDGQKCWNKNKDYPLNNINNILIISGEPRIGKTRLLDEIAHIIPQEVACNYISLTYSDSQTPYNLINLLFCIPLGLSASLTPIHRQEILYNQLKPTHHPENLCVLNSVFNVNFKTNSDFKALSSRSKTQLLHEFIGKLAVKSFNQLWVVIIDDAEHIDQESLNVMSAVINKHRVLFVISVVDDEKDIHPVLKETAKIIKLGGLDKWYHVGLVCQFLNVDAISPELEKVIQERSMGNSGWIESFLLSLLQDGRIEIKEITQEEFQKTDLVVPPPGMMSRISLDDNITEDKNGDRDDSWRLYETTFKYSLSVFNGREKINACIMSTDFEVAELTTELTTDVAFLKSFDSLKPLDQILLKSAAVLGETIDRMLLEKLMEKTPLRDIALSIVKLFELKILGCAISKFDQSYAQVMIHKNTDDLNEDINIECWCDNVKIRESISDLPSYASCQLLQFRFVKFRSATYRLLTEHQKLEFHKKALRYLQFNTRKCDSCGSDFFTNLIKRPDQDIARGSQKLEDYNDVVRVSTMKEFDKISNLEVSNNKNHNKTSKKWYSEIIQRSEHKLLPNTFSNVNFTDCQCNTILITTYTQILKHCQGTDRKDKALIAILEFTEVLLVTSNVPKAMELLKNAEEILIHVYESRDDELIVLPYLKGKIKTLQARCYLQLELIDESMDHLQESMKIMGYKIPKNVILMRLKTKIYLQKLQLTLIRSNINTEEINDTDTAEYNSQLSNCLSQMFKIYQIKKMDDHSLFVAIWSLNAALEGNHDFIILCNAYANFLTVSHVFKNQTVINLLENDGIKLCNLRDDSLTEFEFKAIFKFYSGIFSSYWARVNIIKASYMGSLSLRLAQNLGTINYRFTVLPRLIFSLTTECRFTEIMKLLMKLAPIANGSIHKSHRMWYYILCLDFHMDTGINLFSIEKCKEYYDAEGKTMRKPKNYDLKSRFLITMWLWYLRMENWPAAKMWRNERLNITQSAQQYTDNFAVSAIKKLEALLIFCVYNIESRDYKSARLTIIDINEQFKILEKIIYVTKIIYPRYLLLKAYFYTIDGNQRLSSKFIKKCKKKATSIGDKFTQEWCNHCQKTWKSSSESPEIDIKLPRRSRQVVFTEDDEVDEKSVTFYSLPLPKLP